jgi:hypothetical protein
LEGEAVSKHQELMFDELGRLASRAHASGLVLPSGVPVYELSDVASLFGDTWASHCDDAVLKRPPHENMWCEWIVSESHNGSRLSIQHGLILQRFDAMGAAFNSVKNVGDFNAFSRANRGVDPADPATPHYVAAHVMKVIRSSGPVAANFPTGGIMQWPFLLRFSFSPDYRHAVHVGLPIKDDMWEHFGLLYPLVPTFMLTGTDVDDTLMSQVMMCKTTGAWPALMCFALLHCKNVVAEDKAAPHTPKHYLKRGYPPRVSYKVLKIEVPANRKLKSELTPEEMAENTGPKMRWHLCRGHVKTLRHPRWGERVGDQYWCPDHWKGDPKLGTVVKDYKPVPGSPR